MAHYEDLKRRGAIFMTEPERRKALAKVDQKIHAVELEEAWHLLGLVAQGANILPPARLSAKALLQIV